ncbi:hypothetical protein [Nakamurella endophytica]|uniref:Uncharacterized protein n=1 Tax=Nakamurella endophytica TaxID=1748367 RepID=A0A917T5T6_9ACTN|nr:hypothetical protein [Nakamurella endophytica]GGM10357.1 hypothetical protein GCM10011594_32820 [Nakamurella endophytica]
MLCLTQGGNGAQTPRSLALPVPGALGYLQRESSGTGPYAANTQGSVWGAVGPDVAKLTVSSGRRVLYTIDFTVEPYSTASLGNGWHAFIDPAVPSTHLDVRAFNPAGQLVGQRTV